MYSNLLLSSISANTFIFSTGTLIQILLIIVLGVGLNFLLKHTWIAFYQRFNKQERIWLESFIGALDRPIGYFIWFVALVLILEILGADRFIKETFVTHVILRLGGIFTLMWFLWRWNDNLIQRMMEKSRQKQLTLSPDRLDLISKIVSILIVLIGILLILDVTGYNIQTLLTFGGIGGLALAFASQQVIANFFGGFMIYFTQPFAIGETIQLPERKIEGKVEKIGWYITQIRQSNTCPIYIPNSIFAQTVVLTPSRMTQETIQDTLTIHYPNLEAIPQVIAAIQEILTSFPEFHPNIQVYLVKVHQSSCEIEMKAMSSSIQKDDLNRFKQEVLMQIAYMLKNHNASILPNVTTIAISSPITIQRI